MKALLTTTALLALLATPALAQSDTAPTMDTPPAATETAPAMDAPAATTQPAAPDAMTAPAPDTAVAPPVVDPNMEFVTIQSDNEKLASNWIGKSLYNPSDENVGDVNDLLFSDSGQVKAVIVGVGGFLGIGEKNVAISLDAIDARPDADGDVTLYINATADQLKAAPEFKTLADARAEMPAEAAPPVTQ
ncbi:MAG TPA: PRC-barrel domain-containing protein [Bauldia sp.]|nr:PRC-barrel domain-containing protein [Bauldia sp.]